MEREELAKNLMAMYFTRRYLLKKKKLTTILVMLNMLASLIAKRNTIIALMLQNRLVERSVWIFDRKSYFWEHDVQKMDNGRFRYNFRLRRDSFKKLCEKVNQIAKKDTYFRTCIPLEKRVAIAMYALGSSAEYRTVAHLFGVGLSTVSEIVLEFCYAVCKEMRNAISSYPPTEEELNRVVDGFNRMGFPQCFGAVDGSHIEIQPPKDEAVDYYNYKGWYSTILFAACDHRSKFTYINIGSAGRNNDSHVFESSSLKRFHDKSEIFAAKSKIIGNTNVPVLLIGDSAFRLSRYMMKPYPYHINQPEIEKHFNYRLSKCRRVIENAFGQLKARFRKLGRGLQVAAKHCDIIIYACCILHNFLKEENDEVLEQWMQEYAVSRSREQPNPTTTIGNNDNLAKSIRNAIAYSFGDICLSQTYLQRRQKNLFASSSNSFTATSFQTNFRTPKTINPNKAVFTIDAKTCQILIVNNNACQLLGYDSSELHKKRFFDLITSKSKNNVCALAEMQLDSENGTMVLLSGKVVEMTTKHDTKVAVSLWMRQIDTEGRCLAVAEPVERRVCELQIDRLGTITHADRESLVLFQYESTNQLVGLDIYSLIPAIKLPDNECSTIPKNIRKQKATGRTADCITFPLCLLIEFNEKKTESSLEGSSRPYSVFDITVWVFQNLSGLIVTDEQGNIQSCNQHFSLIMFGYPQDKIQNMHIMSLVPNFCKEMNVLESRSRNLTDSSVTSEEWIVEGEAALQSGLDKACPVLCRETTSESISYPANASSLLCSTSSTTKNLERPPKSSASDLTISTKIEADYFTAADDAITPVNPGGVDFRTLGSFDSTQNSSPRNCTPSSPSKVFSTTSIQTTSSSSSIQQIHYKDGKFKGEALHADGTLIDILYIVSSEVLPCNSRIYCIWICRDPDSVFETEQEKNSNLTLTFNSITSTVDYSLGQVIKTTAAQNTSQPNSVSFVSLNEEEQIAGDFSKHYTTLKQIGKGAYGCVKMAYRNTDRLLVITKFIFKDKLCSHLMVVDDQKQEIPIEIYILKSIRHLNIVSILDVFENENFFQLVMEKHGSGMDLFEFIERRPLMDEKLASYIFRQIANAVHYLHSLNILHRDIKDENIIIDQNFHVKLIDFGSATFMEEGKLFSTFFGTTEYCSPEVLAGNKYAGPELEMWSLGVTLYVIMFFENPFIDIEETLKAELIVPQKVSESLHKLLHTLLNKNPVQRYSIHQLIEDPWIRQEVNPSLYHFSWIIPCESFEANPEKYFTGRISSSTTALSTISPQEGLSLVDEGSIIDNEPDMIREDNDLSAVQKSLTYKTNEHSSWSGNIRDVYSVESLEDDEHLERQINRSESRMSTLSNSTCDQTQHQDCFPFKDNKSVSSASETQKNHIKINYSLSKMNVSDFALDIKSNKMFKERRIYLNSKNEKSFEDNCLQLSLSKSEPNLSTTKKGFGELKQATLSLKSLSPKDLFPVCKNYTNLILNEFSQSQLEKNFLP